MYNNNINTHNTTIIQKIEEIYKNTQKNNKYTKLQNIPKLYKNKHIYKIIQKCTEILIIHNNYSKNKIRIHKNAKKQKYDTHYTKIYPNHKQQLHKDTQNTQIHNIKHNYTKNGHTIQKTQLYKIQFKTSNTQISIIIQTTQEYN